MKKQQKIAFHMAKVIQDQSLLLTDRRNELELEHEAALCGKLQEDAERLYRSLSARLNEQQDGA
ncbi:RNA polymerase [Klebsiella variicola]|uniref:Rop family plasmid primer RNA-binding protein n=1 Tax=Klebsiella variicola TaxID=244366 RepID=UPI000B534BBA|nr:Rop family plasmid primer RNA-binding protein [Klebsiella variicola]OWW13923.1 RNA polymerase [Klebsiella variicola]